MTTNLVGVVWILLSVVVTGCCCFSMIQPAWLINPLTLNSLGMCSYCVRDHRVDEFTQICGIYGGYFHLSNLPTNAWQAASILYGTGCVLLLLGASLALSTLCIEAPRNLSISMATGYVQVTAGT